MATIKAPLIAPLISTIAPRSASSTRVVSAPLQQIRHASENAAKYKRADAGRKAKAKKKQNPNFVLPDLRKAQQFSLCDAMRYIRAFEVGYIGTSPKYDLAIRLRTLKNGPVVRNRVKLPHPVRSDIRVCVIADPELKEAQAAKAAGAILVGEEHVFDLIKEGKLEFDRCLAHPDSLQKLQKAGVARILGPRGLMPSAKTGTVTKNLASLIRDMAGATEYRERTGVIRVAVGQLGFTPEEMQKNVQVLMESVKKDLALLSDRITKDVHEVVLSSTHAPGFSLTGAFRSEDSPPTAALSTL